MTTFNLIFIGRSSAGDQVQFRKLGSETIRRQIGRRLEADELKETE